MKKVLIKNRKNMKMAVVVDKAKDQKGLVFVMHGLGGFKEQEHIQVFAQAFKEKGYTTVLFDTTSTLGESDGKYEDATITNYYEDLEDVIAWAEKQGWYKEPFAMAGHSLGGICMSLYAQKYPEKVFALAPISTVVSGKLSVEAHDRFEPESYKEWKRTGWQESESKSKPGIMKRLPWSHVEDRLKYDLLPNVSKLTMPTLLIVGERDTSTPSDQQEILYNALPGPKEYHIIKGSEHTFRDPKHLEEIKQIFLNWIDKINNP
ncbi:alpha/beta hydrolase family protein [Patescibacteria group bacterium]